MTPSERQAKKRRLERAGFRALPTGWVSAEFAEMAQAHIDACQKDVEEAASADLPLGRPRKTGT